MVRATCPQSRGLASSARCVARGLRRSATSGCRSGGLGQCGGSVLWLGTVCVVYGRGVARGVGLSRWHRLVSGLARSCVAGYSFAWCPRSRVVNGVAWSMGSLGVVWLGMVCVVCGLGVARDLGGSRWWAWPLGWLGLAGLHGFAWMCGLGIARSVGLSQWHGLVNGLARSCCWAGLCVVWAWHCPWPRAVAMAGLINVLARCWAGHSLRGGLWYCP